MVDSAAVRGRYGADYRVGGKAPTADYLNALLVQAWSQHSAQRNLDAEMEALIDDTADLGLPDVGIESEEVRGGYAMELVQRICGWWPKPPVIHIPSPGAGDDPEQFADDFEEALNALVEIQSLSKRGPEAVYFEAIKQDITAYGRAFGVVLPDPRKYADYPVAQDAIDDPKAAKAYLDDVAAFTKGKMPPIRLAHLPARRVLPFFDDDGLCELFWISTERVYDVLDKADARGITLTSLPKWLQEDPDRRSNELVTVIHYINRNWCAELVGSPHQFPPLSDNADWIEDCELMGEPYEHWLEDRVPVAYYPGMPTPLTAWHKKTVSALYPVRNIILMLDRLSSMQATAVRIWAWPTPVLRTSLQMANVVEPMIDGRPRPVEIVPGLMTMLWPDEEISFLEWHGSPVDARLVVERLQEQFNRIGLPPVESGSGDLSGYAAAQLRAYGQGKYQSLNAGLRQGTHDLAWIEVEYLKQMPAPVWVPTMSELTGGATITIGSKKRAAYLKINPEQLSRRNFEILVTLDSDRSADRIANWQAATAARAFGMPKQMIYEDILGYENGSRITLMERVEEFENTPEAKQVYFGEALKQGRLILAQEASGQSGAGGLDEGALMEFSPGQITAMAQAGMLDPALAQRVIAAQQGNASTGATLGAMAGGGAPGQAAPGPYNSPTGAPAASLQGLRMEANGVPLNGPLAGASGALGALGGAPSPAAGSSGIRGTGRAAGQSRAAYQMSSGQ